MAEAVKICMYLCLLKVLGKKERECGIELDS